jgi:uncharacterized protein
MATLYDFSIPALIRGLTNTLAILDKAATYSAAKKLDATTLARARLFPDMLPLSAQIQIACDTAKGAASRLAGVDNPKHEDTETTLAELKSRVEKTLQFVRGIKPEQIGSDETRAIELKFPSGVVKFTAISYLTEFVLPNFYFHITMVYALLRESGVEIGKGDYLGALPR